ncbi:MAG: phosphonate C-P lyase system protein PhnG [Ferrovibrio sp.]|jgi:alpha-D-ribose 1-methylphosphonate 5-triphosphate synthase subunit PhnG|uniref:phosphonate C-P lyase system protein PhnG n=1 Tax=Ferrovibrio sp. TaxID=1917215 RepID=UPI00391D6FCF
MSAQFPVPPAPLPPAADDQAARRRRIGLLARADRAMLERAWDRLDPKPAFRRLKQPETGLAMVRARAGGNGQRFNLGEMTLTRCVVALDAAGIMGVGYVAGRDARRAELAALFDALAQQPQHAATIETELLTPVQQAAAAARQARAAKVAATKVDFFTLVRGED